MLNEVFDVYNKTKNIDNDKLLQLHILFLVNILKY